MDDFAPNTGALGDDGSGQDDEDGLVFPSKVVPGLTALFTVTVNSPTGLGTRVYFGLWVDWDTDGAFDDFYPGYGDTHSPTDVGVVVTVPASYQANDPVYFRLRATDSPLSSGQSGGTILNGEVEDYRDEFPTAVSLAGFTAVKVDDGVLLEWETATELDNLGFNLYQAESATGPRVKLNDTLIPAQEPGSVWGAVYQFVDSGVISGTQYYYWLEDVDIYGVATLHGPAVVGAANGPTAVALRSMQAPGGGRRELVLALGLLVSLLVIAALRSLRSWHWCSRSRF